MKYTKRINKKKMKIEKNDIPLNINLWNIADGKTKTIIRYINQLKPLPDFTARQTHKFEEIKKKALQTLNTNKMLKIIGYKYADVDNIYNIND